MKKTSIYTLVFILLTMSAKFANAATEAGFGKEGMSVAALPDSLPAANKPAATKEEKKEKDGKVADIKKVPQSRKQIKPAIISGTALPAIKSIKVVKPRIQTKVRIGL